MISLLGKRSLAVLLDPDKGLETHKALLQLMQQQAPQLLMVGGSTATAASTCALVQTLKQTVDAPVLLFPGNSSQISPLADGILFLSLLSGRNPDWLIGEQVKAAPLLAKTSLQIIPTGYILVDGGRESSVQRASGTQPIPHTQVDTICHTALAAQMLGMQAVYLEAGSGALRSLSPHTVSKVRAMLHIPLIVGGGLRTAQAVNELFEAGADVVVVGNALEENPQLYLQLQRLVAL